MGKNKIQPIPLMDGDDPPDHSTLDPKGFGGWHDPQDADRPAFVWPDLPGIGEPAPPKDDNPCEVGKYDPPAVDGAEPLVFGGTIANVTVSGTLEAKDCEMCVYDKASPFDPPCYDCARLDESKKHFKQKTCNNCRHWSRPPNSSPCLESVCVNKSRWQPGVISLGDNSEGYGERKICRTCGHYDTLPGQHPCSSDVCISRSHWIPRLASQKGEVNHGH